MENSSFFEAVFELISFDSHELHITVRRLFFLIIIVVENWRFAIRVYFFSLVQRRWLYWNLNLSVNFSWIAFSRSRFVCIKGILFLFYHLFLHLSFFLFLFLLLFKGSTVFSLLLFTFLFKILFIFHEWVWVSVLECCFFTYALSLVVLLCWYLGGRCWTLINVEIIIVVQLSLKFLLLFLSYVFILLMVGCIVKVFVYGSVSIYSPKRILVLTLLKLEFLLLSLIHNWFLLSSFNWSLHGLSFRDKRVFIKWRWILKFLFLKLPLILLDEIVLSWHKSRLLKIYLLIDKFALIFIILRKLIGIRIKII